MSRCKDREELHSLLCNLLGSSNVYYQPPDNIQMSYPAVVYELDDMTKVRANNNTYFLRLRFLVTYIDKRPDSTFPQRFLRDDGCYFNRHYVAEGLNHYAFVYYTGFE